MRIINSNKLHNGTYSATNESLNYPVENLDHPFLSKRFQATEDNSTIQIDLNTPADIDAIAYGLTNATTGSIKLYTESGGSYTLVETVTMSFTYYSNMVYTTTIRANIARIVFELSTATDYLYLGGVSAGEAFEIEYPLSNFDRPHVDNTTWLQTAGGQSIANYRKPLKQISLTFNTEGLTEANNFITIYEDIGVGAPFYVDFFYGKRELVTPLYCCFSSPPDDNGVGVDRTITIYLQECR